MGALVKRGVDGGIARVNSANMTCRCCIDKFLLTKLDSIAVSIFVDMTHSQMLGKFEYTRGPIFKVVLEC